MTFDWSEVRALWPPPFTRAYLRAHTRWHLLGGVALYALLGSVPLVAVVSLLRQEVLREAKGPLEFPLYAMVWDTVTATVAAALAAFLWRLRG